MNAGSGGGITFAGLLTVLFIGLRLGHVINWPWVWVLAPAWGSVAFVIAVVVVVLGVAYIAATIKERKGARR